MKTYKSPLRLLLVIALFVLANCTKKEADNPFDAGTPKEIFTPADFKAVMEGNSVKLSWSQENMQINGYVVNRSENDGTMTEVARIDKATKTWTDTKVLGGTKYGYQLYAYAGANLSNPLQTSITTPALGATVTTVTAASDITAISATLGGNVTSDGGATVTERGICYGTSSNPTTANSKVAMGNGTGIFSGSVTGLTANITYYAKAYATNSFGTAYGNEINFKTTQLLLATVTTTDAANMTAISAVLGGNVTGDGNATVTERGICYSTTENPTTANSKLIMGNGIGTFSNTVTGLSVGTTYYAKAYAINSQGTAYGAQISFTTAQLSLATVTTADATNITGTTVGLGGNVTNDGNSAVTERGVCYGINQNPTTAGTKIVIGTGTGAFSNSVTGLTDGIKYYAKAYAINSKGTAYGDEISFTTTTISLATITSTAANNIGSTSATLGGSITSDGNSAVTERGVCYGTTQNPTTTNLKLAIGTGTGSFNNTVSGLNGSTTYYVRAYAVNGKGTAYGEQISFTTTKLITLASLSTSIATDLALTSAVVGGNITDDGGDVITERGVCYKISDNGGAALITNTKVKIGAGTGLFSTTIVGLAPNTIYSLRAYAYNSVGLAYGPEIKLTTLGKIPQVQTNDATNILETSFIAWGTVISDEGSTVTERGICYSKTNNNPTIYDTKAPNGSGLGNFNTQFNTLAPNTNYYVKAYAINKNGVAYGEMKTIKTLDAYYAGFENGLPSGWSGMWAISSDSPFEGFSCLKSVNVNDSIVFIQTILNPNGGQISFYYRASGLNPTGWGTVYTETAFFIDNVLQANFSDGSWTLKTYSITPGKHKFKWVNLGSKYISTAYIDYFIGPK
jgi:hypothetical protein